MSSRESLLLESFTRSCIQNRTQVNSPPTPTALINLLYNDIYN
jgi:hypothetical protein